MKKVKLFFTQFCPHCVGCKEFIEENNLNVELMDATTDQEIKKELLEVGGKLQVPMLSIDDKPMFESSDILNWLKENKDQLK